jgi:transcriptional regulator GlxA family with amidase domain
MPRSRTRSLAIDFPIQACLHIECPYNPECPPEIVESLLAQLSPKLKLAVEYLRKNHKDPSFTVASLEKEFNISLRCFEQLFSEELGCTPIQCLEQLRIFHVQKQMNEHPMRRLKEAWDKAGFNSRWSYYYALNKYPPPRNRKTLL